MKARLAGVILVSALCASLLVPGLAGAETGASIITRSVSVSTRAPDASKWQSTVLDNGAKRIFKCKPLACLVPETVTFTFEKGSLTPPKPDSLQKFATVDLPAKIRASVTDPTEQVDNLFAAVTKVKSYPAVLNETRLSRAAKTAYIETAIVFTGPAIIKVESASTNQKLAKESLSQFLDAMEIKEMQSSPTAPGASAPPAEQRL